MSQITLLITSMEGKHTSPRTMLRFWLILSFVQTCIVHSFCPPVVVPPRTQAAHDHVTSNVYFIPSGRQHAILDTSKRTTPLRSTRRYGPADEEEDCSRISDNNSATSSVVWQQQKNQLHDLVINVLSLSDPSHVPSLLTKQVPLILDIMSQQEQAAKMVQSIVDDTAEEQGDESGQRVAEAIEAIFSFVEEFVDQTVSIDKQHKELLGKVLRAISDRQQTVREREDALDRILQQEPLSAGFLRHLESECERISAAPRITKESARLLQLLRTIQARVVDELGKRNDLGEAAQVLGQLVAYDKKSECLAVLDAGLTVRGAQFALEMKELTQEALVGFTSVPGGVDPDLVNRVRYIHARLESYLGEQSQEMSFQ